jgi:hypothetical protein
MHLPNRRRTRGLLSAIVLLGTVQTRAFAEDYLREEDPSLCGEQSFTVGACPANPNQTCSELTPASVKVVVA